MSLRQAQGKLYSDKISRKNIEHRTSNEEMVRLRRM